MDEKLLIFCKKLGVGVKPPSERAEQISSLVAPPSIAFFADSKESMQISIWNIEYIAQEFLESDLNNDNWILTVCWKVLPISQKKI